MKFHNNLFRLFSGRTDGNGGNSFPPREIISHEERAALIKSFQLYVSGGGVNGRTGLSLASGISSELARLTLSEFSADFGDSPAGNILKSSLSDFFGSLKKSAEYAIATGGVIFKPCYSGKRISVQTFLPFDFYPLGVDSCGNIDECAFVYTASVENKSYVRIEEHRRYLDGYIITNRAFEGSRGNGRSCPLSCVGEWEHLSPKVVIRCLDKPLFAYFSMPFGNLTSVSSPLGVPVFRRAEKLIKEADEQFARLIWEFEGGELAIDASEDAFRVGKNGKPSLPIGKERLYRTNALDACCSSNELLKTFSPALRDKSLINGLNRIIMLVEDTCGIARGTFSDPAQIARTATEVRAMFQRTHTTVSAIQSSLKDALYELMRAIKDISSLYSLGYEKVTCRFEMGDGVLIDQEKEREIQREEVKCGILTADEYRRRWYN